MSDESSNEGYSPEIERQTPSSFICSSSGRRRLFDTDDREANQQLQILQEIKASIGSLSNRMDTIDKRLKSVEQNQKEVLSPSCSSSVESLKKKIPAKVRVSPVWSVRMLIMYLSFACYVHSVK